MGTSVAADTERTPPRSNGGGRPGGSDRAEVPSRLRARSRRSVPHLALGVLLVIACATGFAVVTTQLDDKTPVLALARPVTVGQQLEPADLREVSIAADPGLDTVPSSRAASVVGSTVAASLPAGALLTSAALSDAIAPSQGEAIVAVAVAPGQVPPEAAPGSQVMVVPVPSDPADDSSGDDAPEGWAATVVGVHPTATDATTVLSVQLDSDSAGRVATAGQVSVVMVAAGGG